MILLSIKISSIDNICTHLLIQLLIENWQLIYTMEVTYTKKNGTEVPHVIILTNFNRLSRHKNKHTKLRPNTNTRHKSKLELSSRYIMVSNHSFLRPTTEKAILFLYYAPSPTIRLDLITPFFTGFTDLHALTLIVLTVFFFVCLYFTI